MPSVALRPEDLLVEYRNKTLARDGSIPIDDLRLKMQPVYNGVGAWMLQLPSEHRAVPYLRAPGAGIVVTNLKTGQTLLSGSTSKPSKKASIQDPKGTTTISGLTDDRLLWDALAFADPTNSNPALAATANDVRTAQASALLRSYVNVNIGPGSPAGRRGTSLRNAIVLGADPALGVVTTRRPRYDILGDLLAGIAQETGLGFRLVQVGTTLQFQVYQPVNRTSTIRLDIHNGTLQSQEVEHAPPEVTRMIVAGQGEGTARQMVSRQSAASITAETDWGLIIEEFKDQRNTSVVTELESAGDERLADAGFTKIALKAVPSNDQTMIFLTDFFMGDRVAVVIEDQEQPNSIITEAAIVVDNTGITTAVAIGDIADFDSDSYLRQQLTDTQKRVDNLERNAEAKVTTYGPDDFWVSGGTQIRSMRGTTAQRDAYFGVPATTATRVALANRRVTWFNTDLGWEESYYATTGLTGLTVRGLLTGFSSGWLPVAGSLLTAMRDKNGAFEGVSTAGAEPTLQTLVTNIGGFTVNGNAGLIVPYHGYYEMIGHIYFSGAAMPSIAQIRFARTGAASETWTVPFASTGAADLSIGRAMSPVALVAGDRVALGGIPSTGTNFYGAGARTTCFSVRYLGPPLANS